MHTMKAYENMAGKDAVDAVRAQARLLSSNPIVYISSTYQGGGVAEMLNSVVPLFNGLGLRLGWRILHGSPDFFTVTKHMHNSLQGESVHLTPQQKKLYLETNAAFSSFSHLDHDLVVVHDPQPLPLVSFYRKKQPWIFRCHVDLSHPYPPVWRFLRQFISRYDRLVVLNQQYFRRDLELPQTAIFPAIDPLSLKNRPLTAHQAERTLWRVGIDASKPIISQVSRFDKWKDPVGVIRVFERVRKQENCQLVLLGSLSVDDPDGQSLFEQVSRVAQRSRYSRDIKLLLMTDDILVNALQRASSVVVQKSLREGFGLVVSEALFKGTPVVASRTGGIPAQVLGGINGFLHPPRDIAGFSRSVLTLLRNPKLREHMGIRGKEHVRKNFLITRLMQDWLSVFEAHLAPRG